MSKMFIFLVFLVSTAISHGQGLIDFVNKYTLLGIDAPISYDASGPAPAGRINGAGHQIVGDRDWGGVNARAGLYGGAAGTPESDLPFLAPSVPFRTGDKSGYVNPNADPYGGSTRSVPGVYWQPAVFQVRAWDAGVGNVNSYEDAMVYATQGGVYLGVSQLVYVAALPGDEPSGPAKLIGLQPFSITYVPEPSALALGGLGVGAFLLLRRHVRQR